MQQFLQSDRSCPGNVLHGAPASDSNTQQKTLSTTRRHMPRWVAPLLAVLLFAASSAAGFAQQGSNAGLIGTVTDSSGGRITGAQVTATNQATHVTYTGTATSTGIYSIPSLPVGVYDVSGTHAGFNNAVVKDVNFHVGEVLTVDLTLPVGNASDSVTVSGDAQLLETGSPQINYTMTTTEVADWPINATGGNRDISTYIYQSMPGTTGSSWTGYINGGQAQTQEFYYEGVPLGSFDTGEEMTSIDSVQEMGVQVGVMGAQYNGGATAVMNVALKSGTNKFHGSLTSIIANEAFNANSYAANQIGSARAQNRMKLFGGSIGGPVRIPWLYKGTDKSFFFFSYERGGISDLNVGGGNVTMPTQAMFQGDFSGWFDPALTLDSRSGSVSTTDILGRPVVFGQIYDPATTRTLAAGQTDPATGLTATSNGFVREPFANNQVPVSRIDPVAANIFKLKFPTNYLNNQVVQNIPSYANGTPNYRQHNLAVKEDQVLTPTQKLSLVYDYSFYDNDKGVVWSNPNEGNVLDNFEYQAFRGTDVARVNHYWTITPMMSNHIGLGYFFCPIAFESPQPKQNWAQELGITNFDGVGFPVISFGGNGATQTLGVTGTYDGQLRSNSNYMLIDQFYLSHGAHQLQAGFEGRRYLTNWTYPNVPGTFNFNSAMTDDGTNTSTFAGNAFASFMLGQLNSIASTVYNGTQHYNRNEYGLYIQDDWKMTPRLTVNLGARWEIVGALGEKNGMWSEVDLKAPNTAAGGLPGALVFASQLKKTSFEDTVWNVVLPRVGVVYDASSRLVLRAGFGINSQAPEYSSEPFFGTSLPPTTGYTANIALNSTTNPQLYSGLPVGTLSAPYPEPSTSLPNFDPTQLNKNSVTAINQDGSRPPYTANYTAGVQMAIGHGVVGQLNYVGNASRRLRASTLTQMNQLPVGDLELYGDALLDNISLHPEIAKPYAGFTGTVEQALAPYPQFAGGGVALFDPGAGWSRYDSMQASLRKNMTKGLSFFVNYVWSKTLTNTSGGLQDVYNKQAAKTVAATIHVPQVFKFTAIYELPFGKSKLVKLPGALDWVAGGWKLVGNGIYSSGDTLTITDGFVSNGIFATSRPNYTGEKVKLDQSGYIDTVHNSGPQYLNPAAFTHVPYTPNHHMALTVGNVPNVLPNVQGPGHMMENFGLQKAFGLGEERSISLRADAFNAFNRAGRGNPVTDINKTTFGSILSAYDSPRALQVQGTFRF